jgi:hypothetical protein
MCARFTDTSAAECVLTIFIENVWHANANIQTCGTQMPTSKCQSERLGRFDVCSFCGEWISNHYGSYLTYSSIGWMTPAPFWDLLAQSLPLYDSGQIQGFYVFAGDVISDGADSRSHMNTTIWGEFDLENQLTIRVGPYLGSVDVTVVDGSGYGDTSDGVSVGLGGGGAGGGGTRDRGGRIAAGAIAQTKSPISGAFATVHYNGNVTLVTRKVTSVGGPGPSCKVDKNCFSFGGWSGLANERKNHTIVVQAAGYLTSTIQVSIVPNQRVAVVVEMMKDSSSRRAAVATDDVSRAAVATDDVTGAPHPNNCSTCFPTLFPPWDPVWTLHRSTIAQPCNYSGWFDPNLVRCAV